MRVLAVLIPFLLVAPLAGADPVVSAADCVSFGTTVADAMRPDLVTWYAESQGGALLENPANLARVYPGYGHPDHNDAGERIPVTFQNRVGTTLSGTIYLPEDDGVVIPLVFLEGLATNTELYAWWHLALADHGYLVFAFDFSGQGRSGSGSASPVEDAQDAITYLLGASPVAGRIDGDRLGVFGHSLGAITSLSLQAQDARVKAVVAAAVIDGRSNSFPSATIPIQIQSGDQDGPIAPYFFTGPRFAQEVYDRLSGPRELINIEGGTHAAHTNGPLLPSTSWSQAVAYKYSAAWFDAYLRESAAGLVQVKTGDAHLSDLWPSVYDLGEGDAGELDAGGPWPSCVSDATG